MNPYRELLGQYAPSQTEFEAYPSQSCGHHVAILAVFDHDWEQHLLVQQCSTGAVAEALGMNAWEYALYYVSGDDVVHLRTFFDVPHGRPPFAEAAGMVAEWLTTGHYGGTTNTFEADTFE